MRVRAKTMVGRINEHGEILGSWGMVQDFCNLHKGKAVIVRVELQPIEPSEKTRNYFFGYCVPEMQGAFMTAYGEHLTREQTYNRIRDLCPLFSEQERLADGAWKTRLKEFEELDQAEANEVIEWLFQFAAENFSLVLDSPQ